MRRSDLLIIGYAVLLLAVSLNGCTVKAEAVRKNTISRGEVRSKELLGTFECTAYTAGEESTGKSPGDKGYGVTASGVEVEEGLTIAADWSVLPKGTIVEIEGVGRRVVQDKGGAIKGKKIDIYIADLDKALEFGRQKLKVWRVYK